MEDMVDDNLLDKMRKEDELFLRYYNGGLGAVAG